VPGAAAWRSKTLCFRPCEVRPRSCSAGPGEHERTRGHQDLHQVGEKLKLVSADRGLGRPSRRSDRVPTSLACAARAGRHSCCRQGERGDALTACRHGWVGWKRSREHACWHASTASPPRMLQSKRQEGKGNSKSRHGCAPQKVYRVHNTQVEM
jgi:hypothetical protein